MSYTITKSDGTTLTTINDGTIDSTTSLELPGPNYIGYGKYLNENLVYLLENFASNTAPSGTNLQGQLWFNKFTQTLEVFTTQGYIPVAGVLIQSTQPVNANPGNTWYDTAHNQYYLYDGTNWNLIGPTYTKQQGISGAIPTIVNDANNIGQTHFIIQIQNSTGTIAIFSSDPTFVPSPAISGFHKIYPGLNISELYIGGSLQLYTNSNAAAYLPTDPTIIGINNNVASLTSTVATNLATTNANIATANSAVVSYINSQISTTSTTLNNNIVTANSAVVSYVNSQISATNNSWTANAASQEIEISNLRANIVTINTSNLLSLTSEITSLQANISAANSAIATTNTNWQANAASQQVTLNGLTGTVATLAPINSPTFTGTPTAPTPTSGDNSTKVATTAFVQTAVATATGALGVGSLGTQNYNTVLITGGTITGSYGLNAATATHASTADSATTATSATTAGYASTAGSATSAGSATYATSAGSATTATHASTADSATFATTAGNGGVTSVNGNTGAVTIKGLGFAGETWHNVAGSRSLGVAYTNNHSYPIMVSASNGTNNGPTGTQVYINGVQISSQTYDANGTYGQGSVWFIVPPGSTYQINGSAGVIFWSELY